VYQQIEISDAQHIELPLRDRSGSAADVWGRLDDWDDGVTAARSEPRATRRTLYFGRRRPEVFSRRPPIGRRRLPADQLVQVARSIRIRFGLITTPFRGSVRHFWATSQKEFRVTFSMPPNQHLVAESRSGSGMAPPRPRNAWHEPSSTPADWQP